MIVPDYIMWVGSLVLSIYFTDGALDFPFRSHGIRNASGDIAGHIRVMLFPFLAAGGWYVMAAFSATLNNCIVAFAACYSDPNLTTTTASIFVAQAQPTMYILFSGLFWLFIFIGFTFAIYFGLKPMMGPDKDQTAV